MQTTKKKYKERVPITIYSRAFGVIYFIYSLYPVFIILNLFRYLGQDISLMSFVFTKKIGVRVKIMGGVFIDSDSSVGDYTYIAGDNFGLNSTKIYGTVIGKFCSIAQNFSTLPNGHKYQYISTYPFSALYTNLNYETVQTKPIIVNDGVWIGANVILLGGVTIGEGAVIGAAAVVTKDVEPYAIVVGNPAKEIKKRFSKKQIESLLRMDPYTHVDVIDIKDFLSEDIRYFLRKYKKISGRR